MFTVFTHCDACLLTLASIIKTEKLNPASEYILNRLNAALIAFHAFLCC
jgi:hypothetical protein